MSSAIKFGTDGWRGIIADTFTFENVRIAAQATHAETVYVPILAVRVAP